MSAIASNAALGENRNSIALGKKISPKLSVESGRSETLNCGEFIATIVCGHSETVRREMDMVCNNNSLTIELPNGTVTSVTNSVLPDEFQHEFHTSFNGVGRIELDGHKFIDVYFSSGLPSCGKCIARASIDKNGKLNPRADMRMYTDSSIISNTLWIETDQ